MGAMQKPFGEPDCEAELKMLGGASYEELYFDETPFNSAAIDPRTYLIIGRRGSGKTALAQHFSFQTQIRDAIYIDVDEPAIYHQVLSDISFQTSDAREIAIPRLKKLWNYVLWGVIFQHFRRNSKIIKSAWEEELRFVGIATANSGAGRPSDFINRFIDRLLELFRGEEERHFGQHIGDLLASSEERLNDAKAEALKMAKTRPIIIAFDTLERYDARNAALMNAVAALVQCATDFNFSFRDRGIHLKILMSGEIFPYLKSEVIQNPSKSIKDPVYLFWRSKDLLRLISWRLYHYLRERNILNQISKGSIDWTNHQEVRAKMWNPYFGESIINARGLREDTLAYVLRHTQKRPRQVIMLCNSIAERSMEDNNIPRFTEQDLRIGVKTIEGDLAREVISSYNELYPEVAKIVNYLIGMPKLFHGNELDKRAHETKSWWDRDAYTKERFRNLVSELGIVGKVVRREGGFIEAVFEYSLRDALDLTHRDECVIHPMFYSRFNVNLDLEPCVIPVSTDPEAQQGEIDFP